MTSPGNRSKRLPVRKTSRRVTATLVMFVSVGLCSSQSRRDNSQTLRGPAPAPLFLQHDYDPVSDAVVSWSLKAGDSVGQSFTVPDGCTNLKAFRVKLVRFGSAPALDYRIGSAWNHDDVVSGRIEPGDTSFFFERWTGKDFTDPVPVQPGRRYYLQLRVAAGGWEGNYELFGTGAAKIDNPGFNPRYQYLPEWGEGSRDPGAFENPINTDYGSQTPRYAGGTALSGDGRELPGLDFAFQLSTGGPSLPAPEEQAEERFAFVEDQLLSPLHATSIRLARSPARPEADEAVINKEWRLVGSEKAGIVAQTALADFRKFMETPLGTRLSHELRSNLEALSGRKLIVAGTRAELGRLGKDLRRSEAFALDVTKDRVVLCGFDERGLMRGLHHLEDLMSFRRAPFLKIGVETRSPLYSPRITTAPFYSWTALDLVPDPFTDALLSKISHHGFDAIFLWADLFKIGRSDVYPELDREVALHQARLQGITGRAAKYGVDVYLVLGYPPLPDSFFERHPDTRGTPFKAYGGSNVLCTSSPRVRQYIDEATADIFKRVSGVRGVVFIVGGEGFIHCYTRNMNCPRCSARPAQEVVAELATVIAKGAHGVSAGADVVLWPYSAGWSRPDITQSKLIARLPREVTFMTEFGKEGLVTFGGKTIPAYDYPISYLGPAERFVEQARLAKQYGLPFWVKTEHAIALETIQTPYIPVFPRWAERFRRISAFDNVTGVFANWTHYGFTPSLASEIAKWHTWSPLPDTDQLLRTIARRDFGPATEPAALQAWKEWSEAIAHYPFSGSMAMGPVQKGPAHPLFLDPDYKPFHNQARQFTNSLAWTEPWGVDVVIEELSRLVDGWQKGVDTWKRVEASALPELKKTAQREGGVGSALLACFRSALHVARFYRLREEIGRTQSVPRALELVDQLENVAKEELENARNVLPVIYRDSRLGYVHSGMSTGVPRGGIYSPLSIVKKIRQVERLLKKEIPEYRARLGAANAGGGPPDPSHSGSANRLQGSRATPPKSP